MPELPEVETIKNDLCKVACGKKILRVQIYNAKVIRQMRPSDFKKLLEGKFIRSIFRRGKLLILELSSGKFLTVHFKMTGQLVLRKSRPKRPATSICRVSFALNAGLTLDFNDQRLFGELRIVGDWRELKFIQTLGPEPFDLTFSSFKDMLLKRKTEIKPLLLDQKFIAGIGNIYAAEILFRAKINPRARAQNIKAAKQRLLYQQMQKVLTSAIKHGGSSVDDYVRVSGKNGDYAQYHQVYNRQGQPCFSCKTLIKRLAQGGRGTYFCPRCQA